MCDVSVVDDSDAEVAQRSLGNIPVEIFLHICSYLDARFIKHSLSLVCKRFHGILSDSAVWRSRITKRWGSKYPAVPVDTEDFNWRLACMCIEDQYELWNRKDVKMEAILRKDVHYAAVDSVHLMNSGMLCVSGSRDRSIMLWNLSEVLTGGTEVLHWTSPNAHTGWVWKLTSCGETMYSCSFDSTVKSWHLTSTLESLSVFQCEAAVLSLVCTDNLVAAGTYARTVMLFDTRAGLQHTNSYRTHHKAVIALSMSGDLIVSASSDRTVAVWDQRAGKVLKTIKLFENKHDDNAIPMSLSFSEDLLYVGDSKGKLHLLNPAHRWFDMVESFEVGHTAKLTCVKHGMGSILTGSTDGTVRISTPTQKPEAIAVIKSQAGEVTGFDYKNNVLAVGGTDSALEFWFPRSS